MIFVFEIYLQLSSAFVVITEFSTLNLNNFVVYMFVAGIFCVLQVRNYPLRRFKVQLTASVSLVVVNLIFCVLCCWGTGI